ncbi:hypothetical protein H920_19552 [Fukomys damarensis]|uniref:Uncharacterized protein n=1 Tax=Fukomys damarensis TaxID=885580 RepID=A0A091CKB1_FUKDA|nr:hypothetical protein H920_19552 [Fukomys damarensis]
MQSDADFTTHLSLEDAGYRVEVDESLFQEMDDLEEDVEDDLGYDSADPADSYIVSMATASVAVLRDESLFQEMDDLEEDVEDDLGYDSADPADSYIVSMATASVAVLRGGGMAGMVGASTAPSELPSRIVAGSQSSELAGRRAAVEVHGGLDAATAATLGGRSRPHQQPLSPVYPAFPTSAAVEPSFCGSSAPGVRNTGAIVDAPELRSSAERGKLASDRLG